MRGSKARQTLRAAAFSSRRWVRAASARRRERCRPRAARNVDADDSEAAAMMKGRFNRRVAQSPTTWLRLERSTKHLNFRVGAWALPLLTMWRIYVKLEAHRICPKDLWARFQPPNSNAGQSPQTRTHEHFSPSSRGHEVAGLQRGTVPKDGQTGHSRRNSRPTAALPTPSRSNFPSAEGHKSRKRPTAFSCGSASGLPL